MTDKKIRGIVAQRSAHIAKMKRIHEFTKTLKDDEVVEAVKIRLVEARETAGHIKSLDMELLALKPEDMIEAADNETIYFEIEAKLGSWLAAHSEARSVITLNETVNTTQNAQCQELRLPKTSVPTFEGNYMEWQSFYDLFCANIDDRTNLTPSQKFQFLRGYLKGEASNLIKHLPLTDAHYFEAIGKLRDRYSRKKQIINSYINTFLDQQSIHSPNSTSLKQLLDTSDEVLRGLKALGPRAESRDHWIIRLMLSKVDNNTRERWATDSREDEYPTTEKFFEFLQGRIDALEDLKTFQVEKGSTIKKQPIRGHTSATDVMCPYCHQETHQLYLCDKFKALSIDDRREIIKKERRCYNCLNLKHSAFNCLSKKRCISCRRKHHTLLHPEQDAVSKQLVAHSEVSNSITQNIQPETSVLNVQEVSCGNNTLLPTAVVKFSYDNQIMGKCRILLDSGSQVSFASESFVNKFKLPSIQRRLPVSGIGKVTVGKTKGYVPLQLLNDQNDVVVSVDAHVLPKITAKLPPFGFSQADQRYLRNIQLADDSFNVPGDIDLLIGADQFFNVLQQGQIRNDQQRVVAQNTKFGWVVAGTIPIEATSNMMISLTALETIDRSLRAMWETESIPNQSMLTEEENTCETFYKNTTTRSVDGRYVVRLPFREAPSNLTNSLGLAMGRLRSIERRFTTKPVFAELYRNFMREYYELGHMRLLADAEKKQPGYYIPHHGILKTNAGASKIRVVFDASAKTTNQKSLNNILMVGPTVQPSLYSILLRFRTHQFVFTTDIQKMYRQVMVASDDCKWQRIVWRETETLPINHFELKTVTYGTGSAPFLATRTIIQIASENKKEYPIAALEIENNVYVDDVMTGASNIRDLIQLKQDIVAIFKNCGMTLGKWASNCPEILSDLESSQVVSDKRSIAEQEDLIKVLGLLWSPQQDNFMFEVQLEREIPLTKRQLLSEASRIFDPLGLVAPCIIPIKILFQQLWKIKLDWDEELPQEFKDEWIKQRQEISQLNRITVPRWLSMSSTNEVEIHGFCDASSAAYGAVIYIRSVNEAREECNVTLVSSKSKVAPVKILTIPKLELSAAVLLIKLWKVVKESLKFIKIRSVNAWSDSKIVLDWLSANPKTKDVFVKNRVALILESLNRNQWNHVASTENPADLVSRGVNADNLINSTLWWNGPKWLKDPNKYWGVLQEEEQELCIAAVVKIRKYDCLDGTCERVSSFFKLTMIIARIQHWFRNTAKPHVLRSLTITREEVLFAELIILKKIQYEHFEEEITELKKGNLVKTNSPLRSLNPFMDNHEILRVGGRINNAMVNYDTKHPIVLPRESTIVKRMVREYHLLYHHAGPTLLNNILRQRYYVLGGRNIARYVYQQCVQCRKATPTMQEQVMADLPACRVQFERPFLRIGVDYAGPFHVYHVRRRGQRTAKIYLCIFVCLATKAVHLELASDMTTEAFLGAWKRMTARRGCCTDIYSDCGSNFIGASRQLKDWFNMLKLNSNLISQSLLRHKVSWHFNPPSAPHFGGIWEAAVKSTKSHLKRVIGQNVLTTEEFHTLVVEIEGILNSRPLCRGENDCDVLTPAHFLIGSPITSLPEPPSEQSKFSYRERWRMVKEMTQHFWSRWHREYLVTLQHRYKWQKGSENIEIDDIVIIKNDNFGVTRWPMGRVVEIHPGPDGAVRTVTVRTQAGNVMRPIHKLCKLPLSESTDSLGAGC